MESMELLSTLKREYPNIKNLYCVDENEESIIKDRYGYLVAEAI